MWKPQEAKQPAASSQQEHLDPKFPRLSTTITSTCAILFIRYLLIFQQNSKADLT